MAFFINTSAAKVYLSRTGVVADGATDNQARLQAILDSGGGMPLVVVNDLPGVVVSDWLVCDSNTTIETLAGGSWKKKGSNGVTPGSGKQLLRNRTVTPTGTAPAQSNIIIRGGKWDGNRRGYGSGGTNGFWSGAGGYPVGVASSNDQRVIVPTLGFYGVAGFRVEDCDFHDNTFAGVHASNVVDGWIENVTKTLNPGESRSADNLVQLEGGCSRITIHGARGYANDDIVAINANDAQDLASPTVTLMPGIVSGPCTDITVRDVQLLGGGPAGAGVGGAGACAVRLLGAQSSAAIRRITIEDVKIAAQGMGYGVMVANFGIPGAGIIEDVLIRGFRGYLPTNGALCFINAPANVSRLSLTGVSLDGTGTTGRGIVQMLSADTFGNVGGANVGELLISDVLAKNCAYLVDVSAGAIARLSTGLIAMTGQAAIVRDPGARIVTTHAL